MSAVRAPYSMTGSPLYQNPSPPYSQSPGLPIYPSLLPTYNMPVPSPSLSPYSFVRTQNNYFPGQYGPWPYQPLGGNNMFSVSPTYHGAPYPYYNDPCIPTAYPMTRPQTYPVTCAQVPYMVHPQTVPQTFPGSYYPPTRASIPPSGTQYPPSYQVAHPQTNMLSRSFQSTPGTIYPPHTSIPTAKFGILKSVAPLDTYNINYQSESEGKTSQDREDSSVEASESQSSEDENSEEESNSEKVNVKHVSKFISDEISESYSSEHKCTESISQEINEGDGKKNASESDSFINEKIERNNENISQKVTVTKGSNKIDNIDNENGSSKEHHPTFKTISVLGHTKKTSKKKKKRQKHIDVNEECPTITNEDLSVSDLSQSPKTSNERLRLKEENYLVQFKAVITEVHSTMGKLETQSGTECYFPPSLCFIYGVSLAHLELWHVLVEGQQVTVTLDLTVPDMPRVTKVTVEDENPDHDAEATVLDLQKWCSINYVPEKAAAALMQQVKGLH